MPSSPAATPAGAPTASAMQADLLKSGLLPSDMAATEIPNAFGPSSQYRFPYYRPDGTEHPILYRVKITDPLPDQGKYTGPNKATILAAPGAHYTDPTHPYLNPLMFPSVPGGTWAQYGQRRGKLLTIVEGEKKAVSLFKLTGIPAIGISGCTGAVVHPPEHDGIKVALPFRLHPVIRGLLQPGDRVEVVLDADMHSNPDVERAAGTLRRVLKKLSIPVTFVQTPATGKGRLGIDDWLMSLPPGTQTAEFALLPRETGEGLLEDPLTLWDALGLHTRGREALPNEYNAHRILTQHEYFAGRFRYDVQRMNLTWHPEHGPTEEVIPELHSLTFVAWMQERAGLRNWSSALVQKALGSLTLDKSIQYNSVIEEWGCPAWDGTPRLESMFLLGFGALPALDQPIDYLHMIGRNWLTSAVARLYDPGCQVDTMLVAEGAQGIGKSSAFRILGGVGHVTVHGDIANKDFMLAAHRSWIADFDELGGMRFHEVEQVKRIITTRVDTFRAPYAVATISRPRRFVMVGSTNNSEYLSAETGNRRFWPVRCGQIDLKWLADNRAQLLAEAYHRFLSGEIWYDPQNALGAVVQAARVATDPVESQIRIFLDQRAGHARIGVNVNGVREQYHFVATAEIASHLRATMGKDVSGNIISRIMQRVEGWEKHYYDSTVPITVRSFTPGGASLPTMKIRGFISPVPPTSPTAPVVVPINSKF